MESPIKALSFALTISALTAQGLSPDEVRVTSRPYLGRAKNIFHVETKLLEIGVVVRDSHGQAISGLTKENFQIRDNGKNGEIASFAIESTLGSVAQAAPPSGGLPLPEAAEKTNAAAGAALHERYIALYFDDVNAKDGQHSNDLKQTQEAAQKYVKEALRPGVHMGIFTASGAQTLDFSTDVAKLIETIGSIRAHVRLSESGCPPPYLSYLIVVRHDTEAVNDLMVPRDLDRKALLRECRISGIQQAQQVWQRARQISADTLDSIGHVADHLGTMPGTRVLLLASSGFLAATLEQQRDQVISRALEAGVVINALDSKGIYEWLEPRTRDVALSQMYGQRTVIAGLEHNKFETVQMGLRVEAMNEPLAALAEGTGGRFFHNNNDLTGGFQELGNPPEVVYRVSFRPQEVVADGSYHRLKVTVVHVPHQTVQTRPGYFAPSAQSERSDSAFDEAVTGANTIEDFPVDLQAENAKLHSGEKAIAVVAKVDISKLNFRPQGDRWTQTIRFLSAFLDAHGFIVVAKEATMELSLKDATYRQLLKSGLSAKLTLPVPPGTYALREVVQESVERKLACSTHPIEIR